MNHRCFTEINRLNLKIKSFIFNPDFRFSVLSNHGFYRHIDDEEFIKKLFLLKTGSELNLECPETFNEKIQWLKLYDRKPVYTTMVDKYEAKKYVAGIIGEKYIIPTLGVWDQFDEIDFSALPNQFVLKCTHESGGIVIVKDKAEMNRKEAKRKLHKSLQKNYYYHSREWPYKNVRPRIIAEQYISDRAGLNDYKVFNFNGVPKIIQVDYDRFVNHKRNLYSTDWEFIDAQIRYPSDVSHVIERPGVLDEMLELARRLSKDMLFLRTDFYCIDHKIYFGELTLHHGSGFETFTPKEYGRELGEMLALPIEDA